MGAELTVDGPPMFNRTTAVGGVHVGTLSNIPKDIPVGLALYEHYETLRKRKIDEPFYW